MEAVWLPFTSPMACRVVNNLCAMVCGDPARQLAQQGAASAGAGDQPAPEDMPALQSAESIACQVRAPPPAVWSLRVLLAKFITPAAAHINSKPMLASPGHCKPSHIKDSNNAGPALMTWILKSARPCSTGPPCSDRVPQGFWRLQGAEAALVAMVRQSGPVLVTKLPRLWERMSGGLLERSAPPEASAPPTQATADAQVLVYILFLVVGWGKLLILGTGSG